MSPIPDIRTGQAGTATFSSSTLAQLARWGPLTVFREILPAASDGFRIDITGNIWTSDGVHCSAPDGDLIGKIDLGEIATNLCFLSAPLRALFVTTPSRALVCDLSAVELIP